MQTPAHNNLAFLVLETFYISVCFEFEVVSGVAGEDKRC
jgi:hypothetical protein